jgi:hypothetical protein
MEAREEEEDHAGRRRSGCPSSVRDVCVWSARDGGAGRVAFVLSKAAFASCVCEGRDGIQNASSGVDIIKIS